jgi:filamentous hemagglutinin
MCGRNAFRRLTPSWCLFALLVMACGTFAANSPIGKIGPASGGNAAALQAATAAANAAAAKIAQTSLAQNTQAILAAQNAQAAARASAINGANNLGSNLPDVPNGLATDGLAPDSGLSSTGVANQVTTWTNANTPTQTTANGQTTVTIVQTGEQALLNWTTFNIGKNTTLSFDQSKGGANVSQWVAFNKINDPSGNPSQILGSIQAPGQVYVINQNGIIFGGSSQVNVHTLVASSLPINTNLEAAGLLQNPDYQFLFSQLAIAVGATGTTASYTPPATPSKLDGKDGDVTVQAGAILSSPTNEESVGGRIALIGPNVTNNGTILTPDGQTILAAGLQVGFVASSDPSLRGLDVYIGAVSSPSYNGTAGVVTNGAQGLIDAPRGDITMAGASVNQLGLLASTTSVALNGRIDLLADYGAVVSPEYGSIYANGVEETVSSGSGSGSSSYDFFPTAAGTVTLGSGSLTEIMPETSSTTLAATQLPEASQINIHGGTVNFAANAQILAPSAQVLINAGNWSAYNGTYSFFNTGGQVYMDQGATIDVSGSQNVSASVSEDIIAVQLLGTELADSPLQQNGALRGQTVYVDVTQTGTYDGEAWIGTPLADVTGYLANIPHTVGELTVNGGSVTINAGGSVVMQAGSKINVSGGWINYQGAVVNTSEVVSNGLIYSMADATPDLVYQGLANSFTTGSAKWGTLTTYTNPMGTVGYYKEGYLQGGAAGSVSINAPAMALDGTLLANTVQGTNQRLTASQLTASFGSSSSTLAAILPILGMPTTGSLSLAFVGQNAASPLFLDYSPTTPDIVFQNGPVVATAPALGQAVPTGTVILSADLTNADGFGQLKLNNSDGAIGASGGTITVPENVALNVAPGGSITFQAANIDIEGQITAPGGTLSFTAYNYSPDSTSISPYTGGQLTGTPPPVAGRGTFTLGSGASLSAAGLIVNDSTTSSAPDVLPLATGGGQIAISAYNVDLQAGSTINVSGGVQVTSANAFKDGSGGGITIQAGVDPSISSLYGGQLILGSTFEGYSGTVGGSLTIQAPLVQVGGATTNADVLLLSPDFFSQGDFGKFVIDGRGEADAGAASGVDPGVLIAAGTVIDPVAQSWLAAFDASAPNGIQLNPITWSMAAQRTPVSLSFGALGEKDSSGNVTVRGDLVMGQGAVITTDPGAAVAMSGNTVTVLGSVIAPGGTITVSGGNDSTVLFTNASGPVSTVDLGPQSVLSTAGTVELAYNPAGYHTGTVLNGGTITVSGNIVAEQGAVLDVSGASGVLQEVPGSVGSSGSVGGAPMVSVRVDSSGGTINLNGAQELYTDATLLGAAGGPSAQGGTLSISSGGFYPSTGGVVQSPLDVTLTVTQSGPTAPAGYYPMGESAIGNVVPGTPALGGGYFAADSFDNARSGFDALVLGGTVRFSGPVTLTANRSLTVATGGVLYADGAVTLTAPDVTLGMPFQGPLTVQNAQNPVFIVGGVTVPAPPVYGTGSLTVNATLIDVGNLSLQGIGQANLTATKGAIRGDGTLDIAGNLTLTAGQIYPTTDSVFTIAAYDYPSGGATQAGSVTIAGSGGAQSLPLSAGGTLNIYATDIVQGGTLVAPLGTINLGSGIIGTSPTDLLSGQSVDPTRQLTLTSGSVTSVSAVDPVTGQDLTIPYGTILNDTSWIDPSGTDITSGGIPAKAVNISAANVDDQAGAKINIQGGGDLYAYDWVSGTGGTKDILATSGSFAVIPGYTAPYAPIDQTVDSNGNHPYENSSLQVGEQIYLQGGSGLPAGVYTLLPARYALLPGAYLVTPQVGDIPSPTAAVQADEAVLVSGYTFNALNQTATTRPLFTEFEVDSQAVVRSRAEYDSFDANAFLSASAVANDAAVPRLPIDAGQVVIAASQTMTLDGTVASQAPAGGLGGLVDIASPSAIYIDGPQTNPASIPAGSLVLDSATLTAFGADSLLIGGYRQSGASGTTVTVVTDSLTVDNAGSVLAGPDVILVSNQTLNIAAGSVIEQVGTLSSAESLTIGSSATSSSAGNGDGTLLRVTSDPSATVNRLGVVPGSVGPSMSIGAGVRIAGANVTLDSTSATTLDPTAVLDGASLSLNTGQISIELTTPATTPSGLVLSTGALSALQQAAQNLSLLSYSSIDIYGAGEIGAPETNGHYAVANLGLHAAEIRGFDTGGGTVTINAQNLAIDNSGGGTAPGPASGSSPAGILVLNADTLTLGANSLAIDQYAAVQMTASTGVLLRGTGGLSTAGALTITTPLVTGATAAQQAISAGGALEFDAKTSSSPLTGGLGASLTLSGLSVTEDTRIALSSGSITINASGGDVEIGGTLDVSGVSQGFYDLAKSTGGGQVSLTSQTGKVTLDVGSKIDVSAPSDAASGGLSVSAANGTFVNGGTLAASGGTFSLDVSSITEDSLSSLNTALNGANFTLARTFRVRTGDVVIDGTATAQTFDLSADQGAITVNGTINAAGATGGEITLAAHDSVILTSSAILTVEGADFDAAGKGGSVTLQTGTSFNGIAPTVSSSSLSGGTFTDGTALISGAAVVDIQSGSQINLGVSSNMANGAAAGDFTGTLTIIAPRTSDNNEVQINPVNGTITGASSVAVVGNEVYIPSGGNINSLLGASGAIMTDGNSFIAAAGTDANNSDPNHFVAATGILGRLFNSTPNASLVTVANGSAATANVEVGVEIDNPSGNLTLSSDWDLSTYRFGTQTSSGVVTPGAPGVLTMRASGNMIFNGTLSDGFTSSSRTANLLTQNTALPVNNQSWSYRLTAGADLTGADFRDVQSLTVLTAANTGSVQIGKNDGQATSSSGTTGSTTVATNGVYQVIRTGTGDITITAGNNVQLLNQFATIYTAGAQLTDASNGGIFQVPMLSFIGSLNSALGVANQEPTAYAAQYSMAGGDVTVTAQNDIEHETMGFGATANTLIPDSEKELPNNWLDRQGYVNPATGLFSANGNSQDLVAGTTTPAIASTSWWVDFSNFFEGIGALGGGNVTLVAGHDVDNVDAVAPTNARMAGVNASGQAIAPSAANLVELGGGNVTVRAGNDINGGVYYVERGQGVLSAGNSIVTNNTRSPSLTVTASTAVYDVAQTWLPTTLFLGDGSFDVSAGSDLLLGPVANTFLLPQGLNNTYWEKTYFSTYASTDAVTVSSLTGTVTLRESVTLPSGNSPMPLLEAWLGAVDVYASGNNASVSYDQPWLRLDETVLTPFATVVALMPPTLKVIAFSGDIDIDGNITLSPSPTGTITLAADGSINALQVTGASTHLNTQSSASLSAWSESTINLSDADSSLIPGVASPYAYQTVRGTVGSTLQTTATNVGLLLSVDALFTESGATQDVSPQTQQQLHADIGGATLHATDPNPVYLYAENGDISGLTLYAGKEARIVAGEDITNIAFYLQNNATSDVSVVSAGRDIIAYDAASAALASAVATGNGLDKGSGALLGDIQIGGPGTLEVLAGRNLNLGVGPSGVDGTGLGIVSIGNERNPNLSSQGASIFVGAGLGDAAAGLDGSSLGFSTFETQFVNPNTDGAQAATYLLDLESVLNLKNADETQAWTAYQSLTSQQQRAFDLDAFYLVLRDTGRDHNDPTIAGYGNYDMGYAAIAALFPGNSWKGDISLTSREIKTANGGDINLFAPGGQLTVGYDINGSQPVDQGILTEDGGGISIYTDGSVIVGTSRIFTLHGGDEVIWSSDGDIAAGASSKTVQSAPPTRVLIDPTSADVQIDLAGLYTGGGIGVLETIAGAPPADVALIAPKGSIDAGDAGIRVSGNLTIAAVEVLNAGNISVGGKSSGVPTVAAPNLGGLSAATAAAGAAENTAQASVQQPRNPLAPIELPSIITVEVIGYGGGDSDPSASPQ